MGGIGRYLCGVISAMLLTAAPAHSDWVPVDLELAFVVDASGSIDEAEMRLQREGYLEALRDPRVLDSITGGLTGGIAVAYIEFAAEGCERLSVKWTHIDGRESAEAFGKRILAQPPMSCAGGNAVGDALAFAAASIEENNFKGLRRIIDISGDGPNTLGAPVELTRDLIVSTGITINGLVIERPSMPDLDAYFRGNVTGGPGSFVIKAESRRTFAQAIVKKMILEIAGREPEPAKASARTDPNAASARGRSGGSSAPRSTAHRDWPGTAWIGHGGDMGGFDGGGFDEDVGGGF